MGTGSAFRFKKFASMLQRNRERERQRNIETERQRATPTKKTTQTQKNVAVTPRTTKYSQRGHQRHPDLAKSEPKSTEGDPKTPK